MDLGFTRRKNARKAHDKDMLDLASLLSEIAARQAMSPTARANAKVSASKQNPTLTHPEIERFAPEVGRKIITNTPSSFSPEVASVIHTPRKSF